MNHPWYIKVRTTTILTWLIIQLLLLQFFRLPYDYHFDCGQSPFFLVLVDGFVVQHQNVHRSFRRRTKSIQATTRPTVKHDDTRGAETAEAAVAPFFKKQDFLHSLDDPNGMNSANDERTRILVEMIQENPTPKPGSTDSFKPLAEGTWRIVYAPHISTMGQLFRGSFDPVLYLLKNDGTMTSHAKYTFPLIGSGWLSVSGTYGSQDEHNVCRVDFDKTWVKLLSNTETDDNYYGCLEDVPSSPWKDMIQTLGRLFFIDAVSIFPVSYLDHDTIVFDFELLGTRICARKMQ